MYIENKIIDILNVLLYLLSHGRPIYVINSRLIVLIYAFCKLLYTNEH